MSKFSNRSIGVRPAAVSGDAPADRLNKQLNKQLNKRLQMSDIAELAGVSKSTVSRALSGSELIPQETRQRIIDIAHAHNYQVNSGAANLRKQNLNTLGVVILGDSLQLISDPFILSLVGHIADALDEKGLNMLLSRVNKQKENNLAALVETGQVAGLLVIGQLDCHPYLNELAERGIPIAVWGAHLADTKYAVVGGDNVQGGYLATRHLLEQGCQNIAFLGDVAHPEVHLRHQGYVQALREKGIEANPLLVNPFLFADTELRQTIRSWLDQGVPFDGVFATSDVAALTVISALNERHIRVPEQIKVVGYDDVPMAAYLHPALSSVRQPTNLAGRAMVQLLLDALQGAAPSVVTLPTELKVRASSQ